MKNTKPFVSVAVCCEKVLIERDGVPSAIRIVDTFNIPGEIPAELPLNAGVPVTLFVALKAGDMLGPSEIALSIERPDGTRTAIPEKFPIVLGPEQQGINLIVNFSVSPKQLGSYWVDVVWNDELLTRIPFRLVQVPAGSSEPQPSSQYPSSH